MTRVSDKFERLFRGDPDALPLTADERAEIFRNMQLAMANWAEVSAKQSAADAEMDPWIAACWEEYYIDAMQEQADREAAEARGEPYVPPSRRRAN